MKALTQLPNEYREIMAVDLQKNKKQMILVNVSALLIAAAMVVPMLFCVPIEPMFSFEKGVGMYFLRFGVLICGYIAYMILHELAHGVAMKICGTKKVRYGFTGLYAFAGSDDYYDKVGYIFIALAPVILWGFVLAVINIFVSAEWFWVVYLIQIGNISGAAGDFYVTAKFCRSPGDILVKDCGTSMTVYSGV